MISLQDKYPELAKQWDQERNNGLLPSDVPYGSHMTVFWKCPICKQSYPKRICNRTAPSKINSESDKCPVCLGRYIIADYNSLAAKYPNIAKEWDYDKNGIGPEEVAPHSNKKYWWICPKGHSYEAKVNNKVNNNGGNCPYCSHQRLLEENTLATVNPELSKDWDYEYNKGLTPKDVFAYSNKAVGWICRKCGHRWVSKINNRNNGRGCPACSKGAHSSFPEQIIYYFIKLVFNDAINNYKINGIEIDIYVPSIKTGIEYDGEYYHRTRARINNDIKKNQLLISKGIRLIRIREFECPLLPDDINDVYIVKYSPDYKYLESTLRIVINDLCRKVGKHSNIVINIDDIRDKILGNLHTIKYEDSFDAYQKRCEEQGKALKARWDYDANQHLLPSMVMPFSEKIVNWVCVNNPNHKWKNTVKSVSLGFGCSICAKRYHYSTYEWIAKAKEIHGNKYDYSKSIYVNAKTKVTIICPIHGEFSQLPSEHLSGKGCKYCKNQAFHPLNSLAKLYPAIAEQWDYKLNNETGITPDSIGINTTRKFWWHCTNGKPHSFQATIAKRVQGMQCAVCHGKQLSEDTSIATINPNLCKEWSSKNALPPTKYSKGSTKKVWWVCPEHKHPDYLASIYNRFHLGTGCPLCAKDRTHFRKTSD